MALMTSGTLQVIERTGRYGPFCVGKLLTDVGPFYVKNKILDEFTAGSYTGLFTITRIFNETNFNDGQTFIKLCASLDWNALKILQQDDSEPDSASLNASAAVESSIESCEGKPSAETILSSEKDDDARVLQSNSFRDDTKSDKIDSLESLKSLLEQNAVKVFLDGSTDRPIFVQMRELLKSKGFKFDAADYSWNKGV